MSNARPEIQAMNLQYAAKASLYKMPGYRAQRHDFDLAWLMGFQNFLYATTRATDDEFKNALIVGEKSFRESLIDHHIKNTPSIMQGFRIGQVKALETLKGSTIEWFEQDVLHLNRKLALWASDLELMLTGNRRRIYDALRKDNVAGT
jgi:hypothetical protein